MRNTAILVLALALAVGYAVYVERELQSLRDLTMEVGEMRTTWVSGGQRREVTTYREPGESNTDWLARHVEAVQIAQAQHPPD